MTPRFEAIGIVVSDMGHAIAFYRELGLEFPDGAESEGHAEATTAGVRIMLDTEETVRSFDPEWKPPTEGHRSARLREPQGAVGRVLGHALRRSEGSRRERRGSVRRPVALASFPICRRGRSSSPASRPSA